MLFLCGFCGRCTNFLLSLSLLMDIIYWLCCIQSYSQVSLTLKKGDAYSFQKHANIDSEQGVVNILLCNKGDEKLTVFLTR